MSSSLISHFPFEAAINKVMADLEIINRDGGLITHVNDEHGFSVWRMNADPFDCGVALEKITTKW